MFNVQYKRILNNNNNNNIQPLVICKEKDRPGLKGGEMNFIGEKLSPQIMTDCD
jgi:hypothetical protein